MKLKHLFLSLLFVSSAFAADISETVGPFGTVDNTHAAVTIPSTMAQDALNVDVSPQGKSVKKRKGYATAFTLSNSTSAIHGTYLFYDSNGSDVALSFNDRNMNVSVAGAAPTVFFSTGSNGATYQCVDAAAFAYCANTARTSIVKVNSSTYSLVTSVVSTGTILAVTPLRLVMAGFSEAPNRIDFSKANDFTTWAVGGLPTDPINFTVVAPGAKVTHLVYAHSRIYWFKDSSFGYIMEGATQADWIMRTISSTIGTLYNTSIYRDDILYFQGNDGHFYSYDGTNLVKLSTNIQTTITQTQGRSSNAWSQSSQSDFSAGATTSTIAVDTVTVPGQVQIGHSTSTIFYSSAAVFTFSPYCSGPYYASQQFISTFTYFLDAIRFKGELTIGSTKIDNVYLKDDSSNSPGSIIDTTQFNFASVTPGLAQQDFKAIFTSTAIIQANVPYWAVFSPSGSCSSNENFHVSANSAFDRFSSANGTGSSLDKVRMFDLAIFGSTDSAGTWQSVVKNAPNLTSWDSFSPTFTNNNDGSHAFFIRSATGSFVAISSFPAWTSITAGAIPTISTNPFFQIRDVLTTNVSTTTPILYDFTQNWFEGGASDKTYALYHDNSLWWSVASGTGASANNKIFRYDLLNQGWLFYDIPMNGMYEKNQSLYFGGVSAGKIFKFGDVNNDNGSAINAYWKSKDLFGSNPFLDKSYKKLSVFSGSVSNSTMTVTYTVSGTTSTAITVPLATTNKSFINHNFNLPQKTGNTINVQFGNNASDQSFEVYGLQIDSTELPWNVSP